VGRSTTSSWPNLSAFQTDAGWVGALPSGLLQLTSFLPGDQPMKPFVDVML
jgi:hypothetical protein